MARKSRSGDELRQASEHIVYEMSMLVDVYGAIDRANRERIDGGEEDQATHNARIEAWTVHVRNLMDFLRDTKERDYILARHYFDDPEWETFLPRRKRDNAENHLYRRISKEALHLTYARNLPTPDEGTWELGVITAKVASEMEVFAEHVPKGLVQPGFYMSIRAAAARAPRVPQYTAP